MNKTRGFEIIKKEMRKNPNVEIKLPTRGSKTSAGYDFYTPVKVVIKPNKSVLIWTDVKSYMQEGEVLLIDVRSSIGIKKGLMLSNTIGIIDSDYYSNLSNDGNIGISLRNISNDIIVIEKNERIAQGIFIKFLTADNGNTNKKRVGGIGSTNE